MVECTVCGGRYEPIGADGVRYFHACPPLTARELVDALEAGTSRVDVEKVRLALGLPPQGKGEPGDVYRLRILEALAATHPIARAGARDENVVPPAHAEDRARPKADGTGTRDVPTPSIDEAVGGDVVRP